MKTEASRRLRAEGLGPFLQAACFHPRTRCVNRDICMRPRAPSERSDSRSALFPYSGILPSLPSIFPLGYQGIPDRKDSDFQETEKVVLPLVSLLLFVDPRDVIDYMNSLVSGSSEENCYSARVLELFR